MGNQHGKDAGEDAADGGSTHSRRTSLQLPGRKSLNLTPAGSLKLLSKQSRALGADAPLPEADFSTVAAGRTLPEIVAHFDHLADVLIKRAAAKGCTRFEEEYTVIKKIGQVGPTG